MIQDFVLGNRNGKAHGKDWADRFFAQVSRTVRKLDYEDGNRGYLRAEIALNGGSVFCKPKVVTAVWYVGEEERTLRLDAAAIEVRSAVAVESALRSVPLYGRTVHSVLLMYGLPAGDEAIVLARYDGDDIVVDSQFPRTFDVTRRLFEPMREALEDEAERCLTIVDARVRAAQPKQQEMLV